MAQAQVVKAPTGDQAEVGSLVQVSDDDGEEEAYTLVGPGRSGSTARSDLDRVAGRTRAVRHHAGDETVVETPNGSAPVKVLKIG